MDTPANCWRDEDRFSLAAGGQHLAGILVKASVHATPEVLRNAQMIKARIIWSTTPMAVVPVLAVTRQGGQSFVFVASSRTATLLPTKSRSRWAIRWATATPSLRA